MILFIGTGAVADLIYLPRLAGRREWRERVTCVDRDEGQLGRICGKHGVRNGGVDFRSHLEGARLAIVATPPRSHFAIGRECLEAGVDVIMEKPLADRYEEAGELVALAGRKGRKLMVNNTRRLFQSYQEIKRVLDSGELGRLESIEYSEGGPFAWPTTSGFYFDPKEGGRGVLSDRGAHVLDLFCWWSGETPEVVECRTDVDGGVEGYCDVSLRWRVGGGRMRLNWHNKMRNEVVVRCSGGEMRTGIYSFRELRVTREGRTETRVLAARERAFEDYGGTFVDLAVKAGIEGGDPPIQGSWVLPSLHLMDECYRVQKRLDFDWLYRFSRSPERVGGGESNKLA